VFHVDPEAAKATIFGGLVASGWHTCAIMMRLSADAMQAEGEAGLGSPGVDSCRWRRPVRPGDTLTLTREVLETWPSRSRPFGFVKSRAELVNQRGEVVLDVVGIGMFAKRGAARV
jgi:acyl dehydratase